MEEGLISQRCDPVIPHFTHPSLHPPHTHSINTQPYSPSHSHLLTHIPITPSALSHSFPPSICVSVWRVYCKTTRWSWQRHAYATHVRASGDTQTKRRGLEVVCLCAWVYRRKGDTEPVFTAWGVVACENSCGWFSFRCLFLLRIEMWPTDNNYTVGYTWIL